jgi:hypothetical protein
MEWGRLWKTVGLVAACFGVVGAGFAYFIWAHTLPGVWSVVGLLVGMFVLMVGWVYFLDSMLPR